MNLRTKCLLLAAACLGTALPVYACDVTIANSSNRDAISEALDGAIPGTVICVGSGTYNSLTIDPWSFENGSPRGEPGAWIVLRNVNNQRPKILANNVQNGIAIGSDNTYDAPRYVEIRGFEIVSNYEQRTGGRVTDRHASGINIWDNADHIRLIDNRVHDFPGSGIAVGGSDFIQIENNEIYNNSRWFRRQGSGIGFGTMYMTNDADNSDFLASRNGVNFHNVIRGNNIHHNDVRVNGPREWAWGNLSNPGVTDGNCIILEGTISPQLWGGRSGNYAGTTLIENNVCHHNGGNGIHSLNSDNVWVVNNTLYHNGQTKLCPQGTTNPNGCADEPFTEISVARRNSNNFSWSNNLFFVNNLVVPDQGNDANAVDTTNNLGNNGQSAAEFINNIYTGSNRFYGGAANQDYDEPLTVNQISFQNRGANNFSTNSNSAVAGKGTTWMSPSVDYDNNPRSNPPAVGAHEN